VLVNSPHGYNGDNADNADILTKIFPDLLSALSVRSRQQVFNARNCLNIVRIALRRFELARTGGFLALSMTSEFAKARNRSRISVDI